MSPYQVHVRDWQDCRRCPLHSTRRRVVLCKGKVPAEVLFIGEAPGVSEDLLGAPFIGPAGKLLDDIIREAVQDSGCDQPTMAFTNLVGCIPKDGVTMRKRGEPTVTEIAACRPRVDQMMGLVKPKAIVAVGSLSEKQGRLNNWSRIAKVVNLLHPSAILQMDVSQKGLAYQRCIVQLGDLFAILGESRCPS